MNNTVLKSEYLSPVIYDIFLLQFSGVTFRTLLYTFIFRDQSHFYKEFGTGSHVETIFRRVNTWNWVAHFIEAILKAKGRF